MSDNNLNNAPITPNKCAAGLKLGTTKRTLLKHWGEPTEVEKVSYESEKCIYENVTFWLRAGKIDQIGVCNLYKGKTKDDIEISSTRTEVENVYGSLTWDGTWHINSQPFGIGFDFVSDPLGEQYVTDIFIFEEYY